MVESGLFLTHKTVGQSSFDVVRGFKRQAYEAGQKKWALGHGGTLDPFAHGLLLVLSGQATRLMELMHPLPKTYVADIAWGVETDTCDHMGLTVSESANRPEAAALEGALAEFMGWQDQVPPATCAKKIDGEAAYKKAHRGETFELRPSRVYLHEAKWLSHEEGMSRLELTCRGGFYVRSLARDLGRKLGSLAHLKALHRTAIGPWKDPGEGVQALIQGEALIPFCPTRRLNEKEADHLAHGRAIERGELSQALWPLPEGFPDPGFPVRGIHEGRLVALLKPCDEGLRTSANLRGGL